MKIDREMFLSGVFALSLGLVGCGGEEAPAATPDSEETAGAEEMMPGDEAIEEATDETAAEEPAAEEAEPEVDEAGPTPE